VSCSRIVVPSWLIEIVSRFRHLVVPHLGSHVGCLQQICIRMPRQVLTASSTFITLAMIHGMKIVQFRSPLLCSFSSNCIELDVRDLMLSSVGVMTLNSNFVVDVVVLVRCCDSWPRSDAAIGFLRFFNRRWRRFQ